MAPAAALAGLVAMAIVLSGCAAMLPQRHPLPNGMAQSGAVVPGLPTVRFWADEMPANPAAPFCKIQPTLPRLGANAERRGGRPIGDILALSGGGGDGVFGAGVLAGWTKRGDRPEFEVVTCVSAGAIIAPLAFLGPDHDDEPKEV